MEGMKIKTKKSQLPVNDQNRSSPDQGIIGLRNRLTSNQRDTQNICLKNERRVNQNESPQQTLSNQIVNQFYRNSHYNNNNLMLYLPSK